MDPGAVHVGVSVVVLFKLRRRCTCIYALGCGVNLIICKYLWHLFIMWDHCNVDIQQYPYDAF